MINNSKKIKTFIPKKNVVKAKFKHICEHFAVFKLLTTDPPPENSLVSTKEGNIFGFIKEFFGTTQKLYFTSNNINKLTPRTNETFFISENSKKKFTKFQKKPYHK